MKQFKELQNEHENLLRDQISKRIKTSDAQAFLGEIVELSKNISSVRERDQLRANLRYWASYIYEATGEYPNLELSPGPQKLIVLPTIIIFRAIASKFESARNAVPKARF